MLNSKIKIALFFGGRSAEHEVSLLSARSIYNAFDKEKYDIFPVAIDKNGFFSSLKKSEEILFSKQEQVPFINRKNILTKKLVNFLETEIDLVFPVLHGPYGEDGKIQGFLETLDIKYIGCDLSSSAVGMDKAFMKQIFAYNNIPQAEFKILKKSDLEKITTEELFTKFSQKFSLPFFVKPANMGSSIGINQVDNFQSFLKALAEGFKYDVKLIIEKKIEARELESAILVTEQGIKVSTAGEIISKNVFYDYQAKYKDQKTKLIIPAPISSFTASKIKEISIKAFQALGGMGLSRLDFFVNEEKEEILVNEINTMPGFTKFSMYPLLFQEIGMTFSEILDNLVNISLKKDG